MTFKYQVEIELEVKRKTKKSCQLANTLIKIALQENKCDTPGYQGQCSNLQNPYLI